MGVGLKGGGACAVLGGGTRSRYGLCTSPPMRCVDHQPDGDYTSPSMHRVRPAGQRKRPRTASTQPLSLQIDERFNFRILYGYRYRNIEMYQIPPIEISHEGENSMGYDPEKHHRRSIRLKGYDYSQPGAYFVTMCLQGREPYLEIPEVCHIVEVT